MNKYIWVRCGAVQLISTCSVVQKFHLIGGFSHFGCGRVVLVVLGVVVWFERFGEHT